MLVVVLGLHDQPQRARLDRRLSDGSEEGAANPEPSQRRQDEQISDLPEMGQPQRSRNLHGASEADEPAALFGNEHTEAARPEVLVEPARRSGGVGSLAVVGAILVEELGECLDLPARRGSQSPNRDAIQASRP